MPADPVMRARARLMLFNIEIELFSQVDDRSSRARKSSSTRRASRSPTG
jgi:hypothetical protein